LDALLTSALEVMGEPQPVFDEAAIDRATKDFLDAGYRLDSGFSGEGHRGFMRGMIVRIAALLGKEAGK
jgi:hypothetical protein